MPAPFHLALSFLTTLPLPAAPEYRDEDFPASFVWFPLAGLIVGAVPAAACLLLSWLGASQGAALFMFLVLLVVITGGLHLDGLADTADGFFSGRPRERVLEIMKDSSVGSFGVAAIVLALVGKFAALWSFAGNGNLLAVTAVFILSRWGMAAASYKASYPRADGTGRLFIGTISDDQFLYSTLAALGLSLLVAGSASILLFILAALVAYGARKLAEKKIGGVTGDVLGAINEVAETVLLFAI